MEAARPAMVKPMKGGNFAIALVSFIAQH